MSVIAAIESHAATVVVDVRRGNLPIANVAIAAATPIYDPRAILPSLFDTALACSTHA